MKFIAIIPARYASSRFPGKPLSDMLGKSMIQRVYEQVCSVLNDVWVATDNTAIYDAVIGFGGNCMMTSPDHRSGTDRCLEAYRTIGQEFDVILNIQGDEPFISKSQIKSLMNCFDSVDTDIATLVKPFSKDDGFDALSNPSSPKVVINRKSEAIYFSRSIVPFVRDFNNSEWMNHHTFYKHIGVYGFRSEVLEKVTSLPPSSLEIAESLEQLRWIENGYRIKTALSEVETIGIDTPEDLERAILFLKNSRPDLYL